MSPLATARRPAWPTRLFCHGQIQKAVARPLSTYHHSKPASQYPLPIPSQSMPISTPHTIPKIKTYPPPPSLAARCKDPVAALHHSQVALLDPSGERTRLFNRNNPDAAKVGDVLLVHLKNGDPFAGVCINIRRAGVETGILLRNELTKVGVEMWYKIYSPNIESIEVVQRREKRARRARLTYMRKPRHDMRSVQNIVLQYRRQGSVMSSGRKTRKNGKAK